MCLVYNNLIHICKYLLVVNFVPVWFLLNQTFYSSKTPNLTLSINISLLNVWIECDFHSPKILIHIIIILAGDCPQKFFCILATTVKVCRYGQVWGGGRQMLINNPSSLFTSLSRLSSVYNLIYFEKKSSCSTWAKPLPNLSFDRRLTLKRILWCKNPLLN